MSSEAKELKGVEGAAGATPVAKEAPTEQQETRPGVPKRFMPGQTVCNEKNEKGKLCNGHLKQMQTQHASAVHLRGDDALHKCQTCGALYMGPPQGHVRDTRKQTRFVERELAAILQAAGGTLPAYDYPPGSQHAPASARRAVKPAPTATAEAAPKPAAPAGETPEQKKARLIAEHKAKLAAKQGAPAADAPPAPAATPPAPAVATAAPTPSPSPVSATDSSSEADRHRPAAEAQASTGQASAAPMSPAAATASPAAGAETVSDLAPEASTELTPGAPKDERKE